MSVEREPNLSPIVSTLIPGMSAVAAVMMIMAMSAPGRRRDIRGVTRIMARDASPTVSVVRSM